MMGVVVSFCLDYLKRLFVPLPLTESYQKEKRD